MCINVNISFYKIKFCFSFLSPICCQILRLDIILNIAKTNTPDKDAVDYVANLLATSKSICCQPVDVFYLLGKF